MTDNDIDALESGLAANERLIDGVAAGQLDLPTPCGGMTVGQLRDHLVGWATSFASRLNGRVHEGDPNEFRAGDDPAEEYASAASQIVEAYRGNGESAKDLPAGIVLMETVVHGWDLAKATGQEPEFDESAIELALASGRSMLKPEYRGPDMTFAAEVAVPRGASPLEKLVGFAGRDPGWTP